MFCHKTVSLIAEKGTDFLTTMPSRANDCVLGGVAVINIHGMEDTKAWAISSFVTSWVLICLHCLEMYLQQNSQNMSKKEMQFCHLSTLCLSYYMAYIIISFISSSSSSSLLNANVVYCVPILNSTLKKCSVFIRLAGKWDLCDLVKEEVWCRYINCNLMLLTDTTIFFFTIIIVSDLLSL